LKGREILVPLLTKMAVLRKMEFDHVILLGNYELSYALGVLSKVFNVPKLDSIESAGNLRKYVLDKIGDQSLEDISITRLLRVVKEMDTYSEDLDDQMYELYTTGFDDGWG
jgi:alpha-N-acetylglucosamine transferase